MIILELANRIVHETVINRLKAEKPYGVELKCADFDGVMFHVFTKGDSKSELCVSIGSFGAADFLKLGGTDSLKKIYGADSVTETEPGFNITLRFNLDTVKPGKDQDDFATKLSLIKYHLFSAPLIHGIKASVGNFIDIPYRNNDERLWIKKDAADRVTVIFSVSFKDPDDIVIGNVFLKEFKKNVGGAPAIDFTQGKDDSGNPLVPGELKGKTLPRDPFVSYVTFVLFDRHITDQKIKNTVDNLQNFRNYLHYHIKCAKSHLHTCMRNRVELLLKILNRAKQDLPKEKKTIKGRTFTRKT